MALDKKPCVSCGKLTSRTVEVEVDDPYGMACSEPELGVPLTMAVMEPFCHACGKMELEPCQSCEYLDSPCRCT